VPFGVVTFMLNVCQDYCLGGPGCETTSQEKV